MQSKVDAQAYSRFINFATRCKDSAESVVCTFPSAEPHHYLIGHIGSTGRLADNYSSCPLTGQ